MAGSVNKVALLGVLGRDPEVRYTQGNQKIVHLSIATSERWKDKQSGQAQERTEWHRVVIFNEALADVAEKYLAKGRTVYLEGQLQTRKWADQSGAERYSTEIVLSRFKGELVLLGGGERESGGAQRRMDERELAEQGHVRPTGGRAAKGPHGGLDDEIPF